MRENIQTSNIMKSLYPATSYTSPCSLLRCVLLILAMSLFVTPGLYANFEEGEAAYQRKDYATALRHLRPLAEQGNTWAQNRLGYMYKYGWGVTKSPAEAVKWFRKAAEQGDAEAQVDLGVMYHKGYGVGKDYVEAVKWYRKSVEQGNIRAQCYLGVMYHKGYGVGKDDIEAVKWFRKSAEQGNGLAQSYLGSMYDEGYGVAEDDVEAMKWYRKAAEQGDVAGMFMLNIKRGIKEASARRDKLAERTATTTQRQKPPTPSPTLPPILSFEDITFSEVVLDAEETATLSIRIKNVGPGDARDLKLQLSGSLTELTFPKTIDVPTIPKDGGEKTVNVSIRGGLNLPTATAAIDIHLNEPHFKQRIQGKRLTFSTRAFRNPELTMADAAVLENRSAAPNNRIDLNEMIDLKFYVQNRGAGAAEQIKIQVQNNQKGVMWLGVADATGLKQTSPTFTKIDVGKFELVTYTYFVNSEFTDTELRFEIQATEEHGKYGFSETKTVSINTQLKQLGNIKTLDINDNEAPGARTVTIEAVPALEIDIRKDIPETSTKNPNAVAVVIGNKDYTNPGVPEVAYAENDALIVKQYLIQTLGYSEENIHYYVNATKGIFEKVFGNEATHKGRLYDYVESDGSSDIFIYYSGHGAPDIGGKQPYLVPTDANPSTVEVGGYALKQLYLNLTKVPYRSATVVIDSCFSGMSASGELIPGAKGYGIPSIEIPLLPPQKSVIFTATDKHQVANGYSDKKHSLFTYFFLKALHRDTDVSGDARLTVDEISAYINKHVPRTSRREYGSSREQTPQVFGNKKLVIVQY